VFKAAIRVFELSRGFPLEERYSMADQNRRASRSVCTIIAEGWRKRCCRAALISKLSDAWGESAETHTRLPFCVGCGCLDRDPAAELYAEYDAIIAMLVDMIAHVEKWTL
jgi:four helix bundle protein